MLHSFVYRKGKPLEINVSRQELAKAVWDKEALIWVDLEEPNDFETEALVEIFNFHPLAIEDAVNDLSQPKLDDYEEYLFLVVHAVDMMSKEELVTIELDIFFNKNYVVTVHKKPVRAVAQLRDQITKKVNGHFSDGIEMVVHAILDRLVDNYAPLLNHYDEQIDLVEEKVLTDSQPKFLNEILKLQKNIWHLRRVVGPQRDTINQLSRNVTPFIKKKNLIYFRDIYDHVFQIYQNTEVFCELLNGILQIYFAQGSHKLNEVVKTMTVLATLAMPSVVIASIYGMNFKAMPELEWEWGYFFSLGLMAVSSLIVTVYMKWKKWF